MIISNLCLGTNAELSTSVPITVCEDSDEKIGVICPYLAGRERCLASVSVETLKETKTEINKHSRSPEASNFPICIYAESEGVRMV